ncbi:MAG: YtxH domain-containing protein, partial [Candidatus Gracilibacteria bacterium]
MSSSGKISLLLGVVTGAVTGLLFAPTRGKALRERIAKEREEGGFGHKAIAEDLAKMADDVAKIAKQASQSEEAKHFFQKTNKAVGEWTQGGVDLEEWTKTAHKKIDLLKATINKYAEAKKGSLDTAKGHAKKALTVAKKAVKKAGKTARKVKTQVNKAVKNPRRKIAQQKSSKKK